jgi:hypothetical protein
MKIQDIVFFIVMALLIIRPNPRILVISGITCLILSIPLFSFWIFFTAQRLTWYAAAFFLMAIIFNLRIIWKKKE